MAYVAQQPWLQHGTLRENILWGEIFNESRYRKVIWACALHKDIEDLGGDNIDIGENGSSLSGGQKARVALARAVYQDKQSELSSDSTVFITNLKIHSLNYILNFKFSVYLIDDVLAALDAHVAKHIVKHCILEFLKDRTRILVTENRTLFYYSNQILHVEAGKVTTSDYALGSIESDHFGSESASSDELHTPVSFELNNDDSTDRDRSTFQVNYCHTFDSDPSFEN